MPELFEMPPCENATLVYRSLYRPDEAVDCCNKRVTESVRQAARRAREICERLWSLFQPYADDHFLTEFQLRTHERWFEMYLTAWMIEAQCNVQSYNSGPDVLIEVDDQRIWVEATCATSGNPTKPDSIPRQVLGRVSLEPTNQYVLRIRNSLDAKEEKYKKYIMNGIVGQRDRTIIAINVSQIDGPGPYIDSHMKRALYGIGDPVITKSRSTRETVGVGHQSESVVQKKSSGSEVNVRPFCDGSMSHISAVLKSHADILNMPDKLGDDLVLYPNLACDNRWVPGKLNIAREWVFEE